jgi:5'-3' exoribonuclease 2
VYRFLFKDLILCAYPLTVLIDGVAPRAKMNQQRSRRFKSVKDAQEEEENKEEFRKMLKASGRGPRDGEEAAAPKKAWDSNVITPGTPFMNTLALSLRYWVAYKLNTDPGWAKLKVIISDATVPGEGEHKIMEFVRSQRREPEHDPNTRHVIYGLDADLIMLGLATHEPHFRVLREDVFAQDSKPRSCKLCGQVGHQAEECKGEAKEKDGEFDEKQKAVARKPFIWLHVSILREYLEVELTVPNQSFKFDLERAIDDWVFLCFFVGNDFLPPLPSLSIRDEGIATLIAVWKDNLPVAGGYVTEDGRVDLKRAQYILNGLALQEDAIFKRRRQVDIKREASAKRRKLDQERRGSGRQSGNFGRKDSTSAKPSRGRKQPENYDDVITFSPADANSQEVRDLGNELFVQKKDIFQAQLENANNANKSAAAVIKEQLLRRKSSGAQASSKDGETSIAVGDSEELVQTPQTLLGKRKAEAVDEEDGTPGRSTPVHVGTPNGRSDDDMPPDEVRMWEEGYGDRYYELKFHADPKDLEFRHNVGKAYVEGLCWVLQYYLQGCQSWTWYYPYHYAPFAADFVDLEKMDFKFEKGIPFKAYEQLMGVLPAASNHAIPEAFRSLMSDPSSDIIDFYPEDFALDLNGNKQKWKAIALLPFIDEKRLLDAMGTRYPLLTDDEVSRNEVGKDVLMFSTHHPLHETVVEKFYSKKQTKDRFKLKSSITEGLGGKVEKIEFYLPNGPLSIPLESRSMPNLEEDTSMR